MMATSITKTKRIYVGDVMAEIVVAMSQRLGALTYAHAGMS